MTVMTCVKHPWFRDLCCENFIGLGMVTQIRCSFIQRQRFGVFCGKLFIFHMRLRMPYAPMLSESNSASSDFFLSLERKCLCVLGANQMILECTKRPGTVGFIQCFSVDTVGVDFRERLGEVCLVYL